MAARRADFIYVEETAYWLRRVAECDDLVGRTINVASGKETSILDLADMVYDECDAAVFPPSSRTRARRRATASSGNRSGRAIP